MTSIARDSARSEAARAWCYWTTGSTYVNNGSFNISSLTDQGAGLADLNLTNNLNTATDLAITGISNNYHFLNQTTPTVSAIRFGSYNGSNSAADSGRNYGIIHGDLA